MDIKKRIHRVVDESKIFLTKKWLFLSTLSFKIYFATKRIFKVVLLIGISISIAFLLYVNYEKITGYLIIRNTDSQGNLNEFFPNLFIAIGASLLGVLAITFSLSLFAIQQAADKHTPTVLLSFLKDRTNNYIFWSIATISLVFFVFAILPLNKFIFLEVILTFVFVPIIFFLLKKQYSHIIGLVNPVHQIIFRHNEAISALNKIDKWLDLMIKIRAIQPGPKRSRNTDNEEA